ncbi:MAG: ABC transporter permease [Candidatus Binatia bacterium]|nr:MAG: ABC transporter permease [Candidatus Binatia bacterium]
MKLVAAFVRRYPGRSLLTLLCLLLAGVAEGVGLTSLLPVVSLASEGEGAHSGLAAEVVRYLRVVGLEPTMGTLLLLIVAGMTAKALLVLLANKQVGYTVARVATDLRLSLIRTLLETRWSYYVRQPLGTFANAIASEASRASEAYLHAATMLALAIQTCVYAVVALLVSWRATVLAVAAGTVVVFVLNRLVRISRRAGAKQTRLSRALLSRLTDTLQAVKPLKAMALEELVGPLLEKDTQRLNRALEKQVLAKETLRALQEPLIVAFLAAGLYVATVRWALPLEAVIVLTVLCARMLASLGKLQKEAERMVADESAYWSLSATIEEASREREEHRGSKEPTLEREIRLEDVSFSYAESPVLEKASLVVPAGRITVLVGPSGAGKTTVTDLILGMVVPREGRVLVDGVPLEELDLKKWRRSIGYVPQEPFLLHESVLVNVSLGDPALRREDVEEALRQAGAWEFVRSLPDGLATRVGERGLGISGGQRQRIALARALVRRPKLLVLDEATAALDPATEASLCATLRSFKGRLTVLAVSHRGAMVEIADAVYRVGEGKIRPESPNVVPFRHRG